MPPDPPWQKLYDECLPIIEKAAAYAWGRYPLNQQDLPDFIQDVKMKVWEDDCAVLKNFHGGSSLRTYLTTVVNHALQDHMNHVFGKWRPSAVARKLGQAAMRLHRLLTCDHRSFREACEMMRMEGFPESEAKLADLAARLPPPRPPRRFVSLTDVEGEGGRDEGGAPGHRGELPAAESADDQVLHGERECQRRQLHEALTAARAALPEEEQLIVGWIAAGLNIATIARMLPCNQKALYKRQIKIFGQLRQALLDAGCSAEDVADILRHANS